jgi:hypothetical protein
MSDPIAACRLGAVALLLAGCHATMITAPSSLNRSGVIKYYNDGTESSTSAARENSLRQMRESCGGPYRIVSEGIRDDEGAIVPMGPINLQTYNAFVYIEFACEKEAIE